MAKSKIINYICAYDGFDITVLYLIYVTSQFHSHIVQAECEKHSFCITIIIMIIVIITAVKPFISQPIHIA